MSDRMSEILPEKKSDNTSDKCQTRCWICLLSKEHARLPASVARVDVIIYVRYRQKECRIKCQKNGHNIRNYFRRIQKECQNTCQINCQMKRQKAELGGDHSM